MPLKINSTGLVTGFLNRYKIWKDCNNFYLGKTSELMAVHDESGIPCYHLTDVQAINSSSSPVIAIDCLTEGLHSKHHFDQYDPSKHYLIFSNGTWNQEIKLKFSYDMVWHLFYLFEAADTYNSPNRFCFYIDKNYKFNYPKPFVFISTVGNVRPERTKFINKLIERIDYKNFVLRYSGENFGIPADQFDIVNFKKGEFDPYTNILAEYYHPVSQTVPINLYNQGYFNLVVETDIDMDDIFHFSEKTIKTIIVGMPFVVVSTPYFLKQVRELGFQTYSDLWDESYDNIVDHDKRADAIAKLCRDLANFDWVGNRERLEQITLHNQNNFLKLNHLATKEFTGFEDKIANTLTKLAS